MFIRIDLLLKNIFSGWLNKISIFLKIDDLSISGRLLHASIWSLIGTLFYSSCALLTSIVSARLLGKTIFGQLGMIQNTVGMFGILAGLGLGLTSAKYIAQYRNLDPIKTSKILSLSSLIALLSGGLISIVILIFSNVIATKTLNAPELTIPLQISAGILFFGAISGTQIGALTGFESFKKIAIINIIIGSLMIPITLVGIHYFGLNGALLANNIILCFNITLSRIGLIWEYKKYNLHFIFKDLKSEFPILFHFSLPAILSSFIYAFMIWITSAMLVNQPNGFSEMGLYNASNQWKLIILFIPNIVGQVSIPILSERYGCSDHDTISLFLKRITSLTFIFALPLVLILSVMSPWIMSLYGPSFINGWPVFIIIILTSFIIALQTPVANIIASSGQMWLGSLMNSAWAIILFFSTYLLVQFGAIGLAYAFLIAYAFHSVWSYWVAIKILNKKKL
jgi:O-antigen/teichoic acid export membrane protein